VVSLGSRRGYGERVKARPPLDHLLRYRAEKYASGAHVHQVANLLTTYLLEHETPDFALERFKAAENTLRQFVAKMMAESYFVSARQAEREASRICLENDRSHCRLDFSLM
jgi:hypothetical protein